PTPDTDLDRPWVPQRAQRTAAHPPGIPTIRRPCGPRKICGGGSSLLLRGTFEHWLRSPSPHQNPHGPHEDPPPAAETRGPSTRTSSSGWERPRSARRAKPSRPTTANSGVGAAENRGAHASEQPTGRRRERGTRVPVDPVSPADVGSNRGVSGAARTARRHGDVGHRWAPFGGEPGTECSARVGSPHEEVPVTTVLGRTTRGAIARQTVNRVRQAASRRELAASGCVKRSVATDIGGLDMLKVADAAVPDLVLDPRP